MRTKVSIHDIAKELEISASTVSRALQNNPRISAATKKNVLNMAKKLNYKPNQIAAALSRGKSNLIGIIIPVADRSFFASVIRGIEEVLNSTEFNVIICQSDESITKEKANIKTLLEIQVDGIFASFVKETTNFDHYKEIIEQGVPLILFDRMQNEFETDSVVIDDYIGAFKATEHLIEQGSKRIVHFEGTSNLIIYRDRRRGYEDALKKYGIPVNEELIFKSDLSIAAGKELGEKMMQLNPLPDGLFSASDYAAIGAIDTFKNHNISVPRQIAVVGFSNETFTSLVSPSLSTVNQQSKKIGELTAKVFLNKIQNINKINTPTKNMLTPELIVRESSLRIQ